MLVIGSVAMAHHKVLDRPVSQDIDLVCTQEDYEAYVSHNKPDEVIIDDELKKALRYDDLILEFDIAIEGDSNWDLLQYHSAFGLTLVYAHISWLYLLKMSHRFKKDSPHFYKTMHDIKTLIGSDDHKWVEIGTTIITQWMEKREKETYNYAHPKLNVSKEDFFTDDVPYTYDHDTIHEAIKILLKPAYNHFKPDDNEVLCSKDMFDNLPEYVKLLSVYEEACVLALERSIVPYDTDPDKAFRYALMKVCTSITSGWWRDWAWEHHNEVVDLHERLGVNSLLDRFVKNEHLLKPHNGGNYEKAK